jgi:hypothetical protein
MIVEVEAHSFDFLVVDPPFLSEECFEKVAETIRFLSKEDTHLMICTGEVMEPLLTRLFCNIQTTSFYPKHTHQLSNPFLCFTNYYSIELNKT